MREQPAVLVVGRGGDAIAAEVTARFDGRISYLAQRLPASTPQSTAQAPLAVVVVGNEPTADLVRVLLHPGLRTTPVIVCSAGADEARFRYKDVVVIAETDDVASRCVAELYRIAERAPAAA